MSNESILKQAKRLRELAEQCEPFLMEAIRYPEPFKAIAFASKFVVFQALVVVGMTYNFHLTGSLLNTLGIFKFNVIGFFESYLLNLLTNDHYDKELNERVTPEKMALFAKLGLIIYDGRNIDLLNDEISIIIFSTLLEQKITDLNTYLNREQSFTSDDAKTILEDMVKFSFLGLTRLDIIYHAFKSAITRPLPDAWSAQVPAVLLRMAQAVLMIPCLLLNATMQLSLAIILASIVTAYLIIALCFATFVLIQNTPLYIYDALPTLDSEKTDTHVLPGVISIFAPTADSANNPNHEEETKGDAPPPP